MPTITIPNPKQRRWSGIFPGEFAGSFHFAKNIDLERNRGKVMLADSYSHLQHSGQSGFANLTTPVAFVRSSADGTDRWWLNGGRLFKTTNTDPETGWTEDGLANSPTAPLYDLVDFQGALLCPISTDISRLSTTWTAAWWSNLSGASTLTANPHRFAKFQGAVVFTDGRFINDYDGTIVRDPALTLPVGFQANWLLPWGDLVFIGGANNVGQEAEIFTWDRSLETFNGRFPIGDTEALCGFIIDVPHIITKRGYIKRFTGQGFQTVQQFPTVEAKREISSIHPNGVAVSGNIAKIFVNFGTVQDTRVLSGMWNYDASSGNLYHAGSVRNTTTNDYAQHELNDAGALTYIPATQGLYLAGAQVYVSYTGTTRYAIFSADEASTSNRGYFITPKLTAQGVRLFLRWLTVKFRRLDNVDDRIRVLYRFQESNTLPAYETISWSSATQFTGTNANVGVDDFVEIIAGDNAGAIARITAITSGSPNTYTIESGLFASNNNARARYLNWRQALTISDQTIQEQIIRTTFRSGWAQFLIQLIGTETSPQFEEMLIEYKNLPI